MLEWFLSTYVEGYLLRDIESLVKRAPAQEPDYLGGCGYPLVMSICSGIELLGTLLSPEPFTGSPNRARHDFKRYWDRLYPDDPARQKAGEGIYQLARHGIAHAYQTKARIRIAKHPNGYPCEPPVHLTLTSRPDRELTIDAIQLAVDFKNSYYARFKPHVLQNSAGPAQRVDDMRKVYADHATDSQEAFADLPIAEPHPFPVTTTTSTPAYSLSTTTTTAAPEPPFPDGTTGPSPTVENE